MQHHRLEKASYRENNPGNRASYQKLERIGSIQKYMKHTSKCSTEVRGPRSWYYCTVSGSNVMCTFGLLCNGHQVSLLPTTSNLCSVSDISNSYRYKVTGLFP